MKRATDKGNLKNIGAAPAKLKGTNKDNPTIEKLGGYQTNLGRSRTDFGQSDDTGPAKKPSRIGTKPKALSQKKTPSPDPTGAPKQTPLQKQKQLADRIKAGGKSKPKAAPPKELDIAPAPASIAKPKAKPFIEDKGGQGRVSSDYQIEGMIEQARKPKAKKAAPVPAPTPKVKKAEPPAKLAETPEPKTAPRPRLKPEPKLAKKTTVNKAPYVEGYDRDMLDDFDAPSGIPGAKKAKAAPKVSGDDKYFKHYGKEGTGLGDFSRKYGIKYATDEGYEKFFNTHDGEKAGGRPGRSKMKTQGMNKKGKRKAGFSGRGSGAALRGF
tara:strand:- start:51 stop:1025 length:975 start_codon:yes stop_codon:yes gene_type:complete